MLIFVKGSNETSVERDAVRTTQHEKSVCVCVCVTMETCSVERDTHVASDTLRYQKQKKILITEQLPWPHPQSVIIVFYSSL